MTLLSLLPDGVLGAVRFVQHNLCDMRFLFEPIADIIRQNVNQLLACLEADGKSSL
jgi:hypothetical protein